MISKEKIHRKILQLRESGRLFTNCYAEETVNRAEEIWESDKAFLFAYDDHGVKRLIYYALDRVALKSVLRMPAGREYVLDFMTRDPNENRGEMESTGFRVLARMMRLSNPHCGSMLMELPVMAYCDATIGHIADISEVHAIKEKMWSIFDTRVSHLLEEEELMEVIRKREVCIHRNESGDIDAFVQTAVQPRRFYFNQVYNGAGKGIAHSLILKRLQEYIAEGGEYVYAWVDEKNTASLKFHEKYEMRHDGMWNMVYIKE